ADEAADDDRLLILHDELRLRGALGDRDRAERSAERRALLADLLGDVEAYLVRVVQVRLDLDLRADVLTRRSERSESAEASERAKSRPARCARAADAGERADGVGLERDVVADVDLGVLVVEREDVRRREEIA